MTMRGVSLLQRAVISPSAVSAIYLLNTSFWGVKPSTFVAAPSVSGLLVGASHKASLSKDAERLARATLILS